MVTCNDVFVSESRLGIISKSSRSRSRSISPSKASGHELSGDEDERPHRGSSPEVKTLEEITREKALKSMRERQAEKRRQQEELNRLLEEQKLLQAELERQERKQQKKQEERDRRRKKKRSSTEKEHEIAAEVPTDATEQEDIENVDGRKVVLDNDADDIIPEIKIQVRTITMKENRKDAVDRDEKKQVWEKCRKRMKKAWIKRSLGELTDIRNERKPKTDLLERKDQ